MKEIIRDHPSVMEVEFEDDHVISVYNGIRIPTGRRMRRVKGATYILGDLDPANTRLAKLLDGSLKIESLSDDEVNYGIPKCDDGMFSVKAAWQACNLPPALAKRFNRELYKRANRKLHGSLLGAVDAIAELATSPYVEDNVRFQAAKYVLERLQGKTPDVVVHSQDKPWEVVFDKIQRGPRPKREQNQIEDGNTIEAEIVED